MYEELALFELAIWLGLSAWIANATPVLGGGGTPIDRGHVFRDGRRLLGDGKTIRGFIVGIFFGTITGAGQMLAAPFLQPLLAEYVIVTPEMEYVLFMQLPVAFLMSLGALVGDLVGSFIKRRVNVKSGDPSPVMDQLGFIIMALIFAFPLMQPEPIFVAILIITTFFIHWISNVIGYLAGLKKHPW
ncbi:MAG: CDP-2,3-bis-(O-geranylgeranyl)-sn-glycerol synthase [Candidatus Thorarchaeota archaeon]|nr:CDP-2,3-bis-(O-geranylgeranyl)-sn-glycerol synthase [Candidatus Thorarchaeota archaeon]